MPDWITAREAAKILGVHVSLIPKMRRRGDLMPRLGGQRPSLLREAVLQLKSVREAAAIDREIRRRATRLPAVPKPPEPPDEVHDWIQVTAAAAIVGCSVSALKERARIGTVPSVVHKHRRWFRLDQLESPK